MNVKLRNLFSSMDYVELLNIHKDIVDFESTSKVSENSSLHKYGCLYVGTKDVWHWYHVVSLELYRSLSKV